ncbi:MAG: hypothetical protein L6V89_04685 [Oscillospiraceae bacterium]|nr:MAG: hypothetical protein L6V89_04685 [Oscillospiraceae bacterium]
MTQKLDYGSENSMELLTAAKNGDKQAADKLVELNTPLVKSMVRRFRAAVRPIATILCR